MKQHNVEVTIKNLVYYSFVIIVLSVMLHAQIMPSDDTYVRGGDNAGINYGSDPDLVIKRGTVESFFRKVLVKFDLRDMQDLSNSDSAIVQLYASSVDAAYLVTAFDITNNWDEETVTWSSAPVSGGVICVTDVTTAGGYFQWDITDYFQTQLSTGDSVISLALFDENSHNQKIAFNSKEAGINPPLLIIKGPAGVSLDLSQVLMKTENSWEIAQNPFNKYSNIRKELSMQQLGPGYTFAQTLTDTMPEKHFGLVVNARGGTAISSWLKGNSDGYYESTMDRITPALRYGTLKGILWLQGSSDQNNTGTYMSKLKSFVQDLRTDLGDENLYFVCSQLGQWRTISEEINIVFTLVPDNISNVDYIVSDGLTPLNGDTTDPHFDARSQRILGERYAGKVLAAVYSAELSAERDNEGKLPVDYLMLSNFPNPFNPVTTFCYQLPKETDVVLYVFDLYGQLIDTLVNRRQKAGNYLIQWNAGEYSSGLYIYRLKTPEFSISEKCLFLK